MRNIILAKIQSIQRCVNRAREERLASDGNFTEDYTRQDAATLNLLRACETAVDLANYVLKNYKLGIPDSSSDSFRLLRDKEIIQADLATKMVRMVNLRNHIVHQYQNIDVARIDTVIRDHMDTFLEYTEAILAYVNQPDTE